MRFNKLHTQKTRANLIHECKKPYFESIISSKLSGIEVGILHALKNMTDSVSDTDERYTIR